MSMPVICPGVKEILKTMLKDESATCVIKDEYRCATQSSEIPKIMEFPTLLRYRFTLASTMITN